MNEIKGGEVAPASQDIKDMCGYFFLERINQVGLDYSVYEFIKPALRNCLLTL